MNQQLNNEVNYLLLNAARIRLGWSMERTAEECDVPFQTTKNVLTGKTRNPRADTLSKLASGLGVNQEDLYKKADDNMIEEVIEDMENKVIENQKNISVNYLKEMYELQKEAYEFQIATMKENHDKQMKDIKEYYEGYVAELKKHNAESNEHYEKRLADKREHIETILLDKKWFRLASVFSVIAFLGLFFFIEFVTPGHGWFKR